MEKIFNGMAIMGSALILSTPEDVQTATLFLMGKFDLEVKHFLHYKLKKKEAVQDSDLDDPEITERLEQVRGLVRFKLSEGIRQGIAAEEQQKKLHHLTLVNQLRNSNKPHHLGTVDEIAKRYSISKSQVRRLKQDGQLDNFCNTANAMQQMEAEATKDVNTSD